MTKKKNNVYFLFLALALSLIVIPVLTQSVSAAPQTKTLRFEVVDEATGEKVAGRGCIVTPDAGDPWFVSSNNRGQATVRVDKAATSAEIMCYNEVGEATTPTTVPLKESGVTRATEFV